MLYLIKCNNLIKIGYTTNLHKRIQAYKVTNPFVEFLELAEDLNSDSIYNLYFANKEFRFKDPKGMLCPYGCEGGDIFLEDIYLEKDLRE